MAKLDLAKADRMYYSAKPDPEFRDLASYNYLSIEGQSAPEDERFMKAIGGIYPVAYGIKFMLKAQDLDFTVPKMEAFWFVKGGPEIQHLFPETPRNEWRWKILIRMPDFVNSDHFLSAIELIRTKHPENTSSTQVQFEHIAEGRCAQILHIGSYDAEEHSIRKLHEYIAESGGEIIGYHKEIYLSDPRRVATEKLKTIIRYAVKGC